MDDYKRILYLRYGSLTEFGPWVRSQPQIAATLRLPPATVQKVVGRFIRRGCSLAAMK